MFYGVYQDWVHQNPKEQLGGVIVDDSKWQARWEHLFYIPAQRYIAPSGKLRKRFVGILYVELDGVCTRKWNAERVILFYSVILQCAQDVNNSAQIRMRILFRLYFWNRGTFGELIKDTYNSSMVHLRKSRGNQTDEQRQIMLSKLTLKVKFCQVVQLIYDREMGGSFAT